MITLTLNTLTPSVGDDRDMAKKPRTDRPRRRSFSPAEKLRLLAGYETVANGLAWTNLHFRHTFGSLLAIKGESLFKIATLMGNSPEICRRHYAALVPEALIDSVEFTVQSQGNGGPAPTVASA